MVDCIGYLMLPQSDIPCRCCCRQQLVSIQHIYIYDYYDIMTRLNTAIARFVQPTVASLSLSNYGTLIEQVDRFTILVISPFVC